MNPLTSTIIPRKLALYEAGQSWSGSGIRELYDPTTKGVRYVEHLAVFIGRGRVRLTEPG